MEVGMRGKGCVGTGRGRVRVEREKKGFEKKTEEVEALEGREEG